MLPLDAELFVCLLQSSLILPSPSQPLEVPQAIMQQMAKGRYIERVWVSPDFDRTGGVKSVRVLDSTSDQKAGFLEGYISSSFRKLVRNDSQYDLLFSVTKFYTRQTSEGRAHISIEGVGQIVDSERNIKAVFTCFARDSSTVSPSENVRFALRSIAFDLGREIFAPGLSKIEKRPDILVSEGSANLTAQPEADSPIHPLSGLEVDEGKRNEEARSSASSRQDNPTRSQSDSNAIAQAPAIGGYPIAANAPKTLSPLFSSSTRSLMKRGKGLAYLWMDPKYERSEGFKLGEVRYEIDGQNDGIDQYLPEALLAISSPDSANVLRLRIVELSVRMSHREGTANVALGVTGSLTSKDGVLLAAFSARETAVGTSDQVEVCRTAVRHLVLSIKKDLK